jgi:hypothetical protein
VAAEEVILPPETPRLPARLTESSRLTVTVSVAETTVPILVPPEKVKTLVLAMVSGEPESAATLKVIPVEESAAHSQPVVSLVYFKM